MMDQYILSTDSIDVVPSKEIIEKSVEDVTRRVREKEMEKMIYMIGK